jgi:hypothetical protein
MHKIQSSPSRLMAIGLAFVCAGAARADFNPVALTPSSYTFDIVVEKTAPGPLPYCLSASQGGGTNLGDSTWFEQGYWRSPNQNIGVPHPGQTFVHQSNGNISYIMPPDYTTNNCLLADTTVPTGGTLTLAVPTTCVSLSVLGSSGGGSGNVNYIVTHADTTTESGGISFNDWFNGANPAWTTGGRVGTPGGGEQNNGNNPRLYDAPISISSSSPVVSVNFTYTSGGHVGAFAISTSTDGTTYSPVAVSGFNERVIVPQTFPLTATMDQGTNTVDNGNLATWFEAGYIPNNTSNGLPPSGSIFSSITQPTHHYQMANYSNNNAILIDAAHTSANIVPASPAPYNAFALLTAGGNIGTGNRMTNLCIMEHQDGVRETNTFYGYDWFESTVPGFVALDVGGRVNMHDRTVNNVGTSNPKLFETYFALSDTASPVTNILLQFGSARSGNATTFVMAISATAGGVPPVILGQPQWLNTYAGKTAQFSITMGAGTAPLYFNWQKAASPNGPFANLTDGGNVSGSTTTNLSLANVSAADQGYYQIVVTNAVGTATSTPPVALYLLTSTHTNITLPTDSITDSGFVNNIPPNTGEGVSNVIDRTTAKYLCYGSGPTAGKAPFQGPVGFVVTPAVGNTVVSAMRIYTANDSPERDPADIMLEGSNDGGGTWTTLLPDTTLALPDFRNNTGQALNVTNQVLQEVDFANSTGYTSYRVTINNVKTNASAIGMQVAEIELLGFSSGPPVVITPFSLPEDAVAVLGTAATLAVNVGGTTPFTFQWTHAGTNLLDDGRIAGSHSNVLTIGSVRYGDAGYYQLNITNSQGFYNIYPGGGADQNLIVIAVPTFLTNGLGWTAQGTPAPTSPVIDNNTLTLTYGAGSSARTAFFDTPMYVGGFQASFIYQTPSAGGADGFAFCLQNDPRGPAALGGAGGGLGLSGITPSAAITFNIYPGSPGGIGFSFGTNGNNGNPYNSVAPVNITSGDPIAVKIVYHNGSAQLNLTDTNTGDTFGTNILVGNLPTILGAQTAYVGFAGGDGGISSTQTITDFEYVPLTSLSIRVVGSNVILTWPVQPAGYVPQSKSDLASGNWQNVNATITQVGGQNQVSIPLPGSKQFYRLAIPLPVQ